MTETEMKQWIDSAPYYALLAKWRFSAVGDPFFRDDVGRYYSEKMAEKRKEVGNAAHVATSKALGWGE